MSSKSEILKAIFNTSYTGNRVINGKADSGVTFDHIYQNKPKGNSLIGKFVDRVVLNFPSLRATRDRWKYICDEITRITISEIDEKGPLRIVDLASGVSRYLIDFSRAWTRNRVECLCLDRDIESLSLGRRISAEDSFRYIRANILDASRLLRFGTRKSWKPHIVIVTGLVEYLSDQSLAALLRDLRGVLGIDGYLIFSSQICNPSRKLMETICTTSQGTSWKLVYRSPEEVTAVLTKVGFKAEKIHVDKIGMYSIISAKAVFGTAPRRESDERQPDISSMAASGL